MNWGRLDHLSYDQLRDQCQQHVYRRKGATEVLDTRLTTTQEQQAGSTQNTPMGSDIPVTGTGERGRPPEDVAEHLQCPTFLLDKRPRRDALRVAFVVGKEVVKGHAQRWNSEFNPQVEASRSSAVEGAGAAISLWVADGCNRALAQELLGEEEMAHADRVRETKVEDVSKPLQAGDVGDTAVDTRRAITWEMVDGVKTVRAPLAATGLRWRPRFPGS